MERAILHSDMNCFYASVEQMLDPTLRGKAIAVCGSQETRHGIVLAKSQLAKKAGVKTGMAIWQAKECCRDLIVVPPQYDQYLKYSRLAHEIYLRYTDRMEPYGMSAISYGSFFSLFHLPPGRTEKALCFIGCPIWPNTRSLRIFDFQKNQKFKGDYE